MQIWALLTRSQCKVSGTQVTVKAFGPLVYGKNFELHLMSALFNINNLDVKKKNVVFLKELSLKKVFIHKITHALSIS